MKDYTIISWLKTWVCPRTREARRRYSIRAELRLEPLDERVVPAAFTMKVNTTADQNIRDDFLSLREAIMGVEGDLLLGDLTASEIAQIQVDIQLPDAYSIGFDLAGNGPFKINLASALPAITVGSVLIDGNWGTGDSADTRVELDGTNAGSPANGFTIKSEHCTIASFVINNFHGNGILIQGNPNEPVDENGDPLLGAGAIGGAGYNTVINCYIGTDRTGLEKKANDAVGVMIQDAYNNTIGGPEWWKTNVISGNQLSGVSITESVLNPLDGRMTQLSHDNYIIGNYIGTDMTGNSKLPNQFGVTIKAGHNFLGIFANGYQNVISGNLQDGVNILDGVGNEISKNYIGVKSNGNDPLPNGEDGVRIAGGSKTVVGIGAVICANKAYGVEIGKGVPGTQIWKANIGVNLAGNKLKNEILNIRAFWAGPGTRITSNTIGGRIDVVSTDEVQIADNIIIDGDGDAIHFVNVTNSKITGNLIAGNVGTAVHIEGGYNITIGVLDGGTPDQANVIVSNQGWGIENEHGAIVTSRNRIGLDAYGNAAANGKGGVYSVGNNNIFGDFVGYNHGPGYDVEGNNNSIFGAFVFANDLDGIDLSGDTIYVQNCTIGTDETGAAGLGNGGDGIHIDHASNVTVGGPDSWVVSLGGGGLTWVPSNTIVHNGGSGVAAVQDSGPNYLIVVQGNLIAYNEADGVALTGSTHTVYNDVIYANGLNGVKVSGDGSTIQGCHIGTDLALAGGLGNGRDGVFLTGATNTMIGGASPVNVIWNNGACGVGEVGTFAGNSILSNSIYNNGGLGIDLGEDGVTDSGLTLPAGGNGWVTFHGDPNTVYLFEFFVSPTPDPTLYGEGRDFAVIAIMSSGMQTDANGDLTFQLTCGNQGEWLSGTATNMTTGTTSEFCHDVLVV